MEYFDKIPEHIPERLGINMVIYDEGMARRTNISFFSFLTFFAPLIRHRAIVANERPVINDSSSGDKTCV